MICYLLCRGGGGGTFFLVPTLKFLLKSRCEIKVWASNDLRSRCLSNIGRAVLGNARGTGSSREGKGR